MVRALLTGACCLMISVTPGVAADMPVKAAKPVFAPMVTWTGFYVGGHIGYGSSRADLSAADSAAITATYGAVPAPDGFVGGLHGGYDYQMANRIVLGVGVEINGFGIDAFNDTTGIAPGSSLKSALNWEIAVYGRAGYAFDRWMPYLLGGGSFVRQRVSGFNGFIGPFSVSNWHTGFTVGGGVEAIIVPGWSGRVQARYVDVSRETFLNRQIGGNAWLVDVGASRRF